jgi:hypothetical protein
VPITVNPLPVVSIAPSSITQCAESPATLNADGALNYLWSPNISLSASTGNSVIVNPNTNTTYSVLGMVVRVVPRLPLQYIPCRPLMPEVISPFAIRALR